MLLRKTARVFAFIASIIRRLQPAQQRSVAVFIAFVLVMAIVLPIGRTHKTKAFGNYQQTEWSSIGTDTSTQYSAADNVNATNSGVSIGSQNQAAWCASTNCNTDWAYRKKIIVTSDEGQAINDFQVKLHINHEPEMQTGWGFPDLRFTTEDGIGDYAHYILHDYNGQSVDALVKIPTLSPGQNTFYMYYGNDNATGTSNRDSTMDFTDHFNDNPQNYWWTGCSNSNQVTFSNGEAVAPTGCFMGNIPPYDQQDNSTDRVVEYDYKIDFSDVSDCGSYYGGNYNKLAWNPAQYPGDPDAFTLNFNGVYGPGASCGSNAKIIVGNANIAHFNDVFINYNQDSVPQSSEGGFLTIRQVTKAAGGFELYVSSDYGATFTQLPLFTPNNQQYKVGFGFAGDYHGWVVKNAGTYKTSSQVSSRFGIKEWQGGRVGTLTSAVIDMEPKAFYDRVLLSHSGSGSQTILLRSSSNADMSGADDFSTCNQLSDTDLVSTSTCMHVGQRYVQYQIVLSDGGSYDAAVTSVTIEHNNDLNSPTAPSGVVIKRSSTGSVISSGGWTNTSPYFSWTAATDNVGGSGVAGYCLYVGTNANADPTVDGKGIISTSSPINTGGLCDYATADTNFNSNASSLALVHGQTYYIRIVAFDQAGNVTTDTPATSSFKYDNVAPWIGTVTSFPSATNTKNYRFSWLAASPYTENDSGLAGIKYCITNLVIGLTGCNPDDPNWTGADHVKGSLSDASNAIPYSAGTFTLGPDDYDRMDDQIAHVNFIAIRGVDNAGNYTDNVNGINIFIISYTASDAPANLQVTPSSNSANSFAFTWQQPANLFGAPSKANYCWTVNVAIAADGSNCSWTGLGVTQLAAGPYATRQGSNTFYIATKDETGNFDNSKVTSINFTANTTAPGVPQNLDISDASIRATSTWKLALSWSAPSSSGSGISTYRILRSTDNITFTEVGSTSQSNTSFIDTGLSQTTYYYKVQACDNANNCGIASNSVNKQPTGRYTEPPKLTADTDQPKFKDVTTRKATIFWFTDRNSDSRIAIGTSPGRYNSQEIGSSSQTTNHDVTLTNLEPGTTYYFVARWTDSDGNTGQSVERSFTTLPGPSFSEVNPSALTISSASINFTSLNSTKVTMYYGKSESFGAAKTIDTSLESSQYSIALSDLSDGTKYFFKLNGFDPDGNEYQGNIYSFTTPARPRISNLQIKTEDGASSSTKKVTWNTNVPTTTQLRYGPKDGQSTNKVDSTKTLNHEMVITNLIDDTDYELAAISTDDAGNVATSEVQKFRTSIDTRPPKVSNVNVEVSIRGTGTEAKGQIVVTWKTDELATSQVAFGLGNTLEAITNKTPEDTRLTFDHTIVIANLNTSAIYQIRPISQDKALNSSVGEAQTAIIGRASNSLIAIILNALRNTFGLKN